MKHVPAAALALALASALPTTAVLAASDNNRDEGRAAASHREDRRAEERRAIEAATVDAAGAATAVRTAGYRAVREIEWKRGAWEVKASDAEGRRVELRVDATTGAVTRSSH